MVSPFVGAAPIGPADGPLLWAAAARIPAVIESWDRTKIMRCISGGVAAILGVAAAIHSLIGPAPKSDDQLKREPITHTKGSSIWRPSGENGTSAMPGLW